VIPPTKNGLPAMACVSAMQKCIRRGLESEAMQFAVELIHTSKAQCSMVGNRLMVISHEDIDTATQPHIVPFVATAAAQAKDWYEADNPSKSRLALGNAIRMLCRADKSREGDHFQAAHGLAALLEHFVPKVPDFALDMHTMKGKRMGRGLQHFLEEGCKLEPAPQIEDKYKPEAIRLWSKKHGAATD
jgi:replication-associated recombination protein RarA